MIVLGGRRRRWQKAVQDVLRVVMDSVEEAIVVDRHTDRQTQTGCSQYSAPLPGRSTYQHYHHQFISPKGSTRTEISKLQFSFS